MRINIDIDDDLMTRALRVTGLETKREAVELGLGSLTGLRAQSEVRVFRGKLPWTGTLGDMRSDK